MLVSRTQSAGNGAQKLAANVHLHRDGLEQRDEAVDRTLGGELGNFGRLIGHRKARSEGHRGIVIRDQVRGHHAFRVMI